MKRTILIIFIMVAFSACTSTSAGFLLPVNDYLVQNVDQASFGGKVFCAHDVLEADLRADGADVYVWALCGEYYLVNNILIQGTSSSLPVALQMQKSGGQY